MFQTVCHISCYAIFYVPCFVCYISCTMPYFECFTIIILSLCRILYAVPYFLRCILSAILRVLCCISSVPPYFVFIICRPTSCAVLYFECCAIFLCSILCAIHHVLCRILSVCHGSCMYFVCCIQVEYRSSLRVALSGSIAHSATIVDQKQYDMLQVDHMNNERRVNRAYVADGA